MQRLDLGGLKSWSLWWLGWLFCWWHHQTGFVHVLGENGLPNLLLLALQRVVEVMRVHAASGFSLKKRSQATVFSSVAPSELCF